MFKRITLSALVTLIALAFALPAFAAAPNFSPSVYGDGRAWGTKGVATLPAPNDNNLQSYDKLFVITNSNNPAGQLPVAEAAPGNPNYNGGRWFTQTVMWTAKGFADHGGTVPVLTSYDEIMEQEMQGNLIVVAGSPGGPPDYFECPLLPVK